ncbi:MAG: SMC-Scp complex subunit ScpB, partial [Thermomicrobium sp.]
TLAIIAYLQPVTRAEIEAIRGVDCSTALQTLLAHGLVEPIGRRSGPGQPVEYGTTALFLERFGLANLAALPPLPVELRELLLARRSTP